jgi:chaperonin cofactor prefoldin
MAEAAGSEPKDVMLQKRVEELQALRARVINLEAQEREHVSAAEVLGQLPEDRRAFRLVGDVMVEQTVREALESVAANKEMIQKSLEESVKRTMDIEKSVRELAAN